MTEPRSIRRRTWTQRVVLVASSLLVVVVVLGAATTGYAAWLLARVDRVDVPLDRPEATDQVNAADVAEPVTSVPPVAEGAAPAPATSTTLPPLGPAGPPENFLIVGSDNAEDIDPDDPILTNRDDQADNHLADTIMLLRIDPASTEATLLSIPRDLWVDIAGPNGGFRQKINAAFNLPDADDRSARLVNTVRENLGVEIHHFVHVDWAGFRGLVSELGGIEVCFPRPARDVRTGLLVEEAGPVELSPDQALAFVRSRQLQVRGPDGTWRPADDQSDLDRIGRQQEFITEALDQTLGLRNPNRLRGVADAAVDHVDIDQALSLGDIVDLARRFADFGGDSLRTLELPVADLTIPATRRHPTLSALQLGAGAEAVLDIFRGVEPDDVVAPRVSVTVRGGDGTVADDVERIGFDVDRRRGPTSERTVVRYGPGGEDAARLLAAFLDAGVGYEPAANLSGNVIELVVGADVGAVRAPGDPRRIGPDEEPPPAALTPSPSTTLPPSTAGPSAPAESDPCAV